MLRPLEVAMTDNRDLTNAELDARLARLFKQHAASALDMRAQWHLLIVDVLNEQKARRDVWLAEGVALVPVP